MSCNHCVTSNFSANSSMEKTELKLVWNGLITTSVSCSVPLTLPRSESQCTVLLRSVYWCVLSKHQPRAVPLQELARGGQRASTQISHSDQLCQVLQLTSLSGKSFTCRIMCTQPRTFWLRFPPPTIPSRGMFSVLNLECGWGMSMVVAHEYGCSSSISSMFFCMQNMYKLNSVLYYEYVLQRFKSVYCVQSAFLSLSLPWSLWHSKESFLAAWSIFSSTSGRNWSVSAGSPPLRFSIGWNERER